MFCANQFVFTMFLFFILSFVMQKRYSTYDNTLLLTAKRKEVEKKYKQSYYEEFKMASRHTNNITEECVDNCW